MMEAQKAEFLQAKARLEHGLATTPDDRLRWSPSPSARTPLEQVAHAAFSVGHMLGNLEGRTFEEPTTDDAQRRHRADDATITTREAALALLEKNSAAYLAWLDGVTEDKLSSKVKAPFGMGEFPVMAMIGFMPVHLNWHSAQLDYIQTIYGDQDWHL